LQNTWPLAPIKELHQGHEARIFLRTLDIPGHVDFYVRDAWQSSHKHRHEDGAVVRTLVLFHRLRTCHVRHWYSTPQAYQPRQWSVSDFYEAHLTPTPHEIKAQLKMRTHLRQEGSSHGQDMRRLTMFLVGKGQLHLHLVQAARDLTRSWFFHTGAYLWHFIERRRFYLLSLRQESHSAQTALRTQ
jgi:hypothetical protein